MNIEHRTFLIFVFYPQCIAPFSIFSRFTLERQNITRDSRAPRKRRNTNVVRQMVEKSWRHLHENGKREREQSKRPGS